MRLSTAQSYTLLEKHGCYITEICDRCGKGIGPVRFTRPGESGVWCSRECRDGTKAHEPGTCRHCKAKLPEGKRRGAVFCDDACRKASQRQNGTLRAPATPKLSRTKPSIYAAFSSGKEAVRGAHRPSGPVWRPYDGPNTRGGTMTVATKTSKPVNLGRHRRNCTICAHEKCAEIEADFINWKSPAAIATEYGIATYRR